MILAILETTDGKLTKQSRALCGAVAKLKAAHGISESVCLVPETAAASDATTLGFDKVLSSEVGDKTAEELAPAYASLVESVGATHLVGLSSSGGKDVFARAAEILEAGQSSDVIGFKEGELFVRPMFAGNVISDMKILSDKKVVTIRASAFDEAASDGPAPVEEVNLSFKDSDDSSIAGYETQESERPELGAAEVVVSGGRALRSKEKFDEVVVGLADSLNAAVGASRAAVDSGYAPNDWQVGQTGKVVAPKLYFALGISGAIQHLAGMKDSKTIVAINKDADAPIFEIADYGLVGDLFDIVPKLIELIKSSS